MWSPSVQVVAGEEGIALGPCFMHSSTGHNKHVSFCDLPEFLSIAPSECSYPISNGKRPPQKQLYSCIKMVSLNTQCNNTVLLSCSEHGRHLRICREC